MPTAHPAFDAILLLSFPVLRRLSQAAGKRYHRVLLQSVCRAGARNPVACRQAGSSCKSTSESANLLSPSIPGGGQTSATSTCLHPCMSTLSRPHSLTTQPTQFKALLQTQTGTMQHYPTVGRRDIQILTNIFCLHAGNFTQ